MSLVFQGRGGNAGETSEQILGALREVERATMQGVLRGFEIAKKQLQI